MTQSPEQPRSANASPGQNKSPDAKTWGQKPTEAQVDKKAADKNQPKPNNTK